MPQFNYRGRDSSGRLRVGQRFGFSANNLSAELIKEGITPIQITPNKAKSNFLESFQDWLQSDRSRLEELAVFARQMQMLHQAGVPIVTALMQLSTYIKSRRFGNALNGVIENLEKGQDLASAMQQFPDVFTPLVYNIVRIGERTGHLSEAFGHLHKYLEFEASNIKQLKSSFRYPIFVVISIVFSIITLNIFVIPTFARFYTNSSVALPWQTQILINSSNFLVHYGVYLLILLMGLCVLAYRYFKTDEGRYRLHKFQLNVPIFGKLLRRIILIRFSQTLAIILNSGISITDGLSLVKDTLQNSYINAQIKQMLEMIERGNTFTQSMTNIDIFSPVELQILAVGEKNGELGSALNYIGTFHGHEIEYDLKRMNDLIGPILIAGVSGLILIMALGVYLPVWNMVDLVHS
jgi:MSHA biogenesis protein MshG